jgi:pyruvate,orthophosphate dikinase
MFEAAVRVLQSGGAVQLDIMVPLVGTAAELQNQEQLIRRVGEKVRRERGGEGGGEPTLREADPREPRL